MARIIGCNSLHIAEVTKDDDKGTTWGNPTKVPTLISIDVKDNVDKVTFYSDDAIEQIIPAFSGKEVTIELGSLTNEIEAMISGNKYDSSTGVFTQSASAVAKEYALMFKAPKSKEGAERYVCLYKGVLSKEEDKYKGKGENVEASNVTLTGMFMPLLSNNLVMIKKDTDDGKTSELVKTWFTKVPEVTSVSG